MILFPPTYIFSYKICYTKKLGLYSMLLDPVLILLDDNLGKFMLR